MLAMKITITISRTSIATRGTPYTFIKQHSLQNCLLILDSLTEKNCQVSGSVLHTVNPYLFCNLEHRKLLQGAWTIINHPTSKFWQLYAKPNESNPVCKNLPVMMMNRS